MTAPISFITNTGASHRDFLLGLFGQAGEVVFATAFLRQSGFDIIKEQLKEFCADKSTSSTFYIGLGMGETDPEALLSLYNIIKTKPNHQLVLCTPDAGIFHPKAYLFVTGDKATIVTGSANLTQNGLAVNDELSTVVETTISSPEFLELSAYFDQLHSRYYTDNVEALIQRYKKERKEYFKNYGRPPAFRFRRRRTSIAGIDMPRLRRYYEIYQNDEDWFVVPELREAQYLKAKDNLDQLAGNRTLSPSQFHDLFGPLVGHKDFKPKLWHSGSIHRTTYKTLDYPDAFRDIVRIAKHNISQPVGTAYQNIIDHLKELRSTKKIHGVGGNIITEILLSYRPEKFANLNDNPLAVLSLVGTGFPYIANFDGAEYAAYVSLLSRIKDELGMSTFLEIDSFFNYVYWNITEE